MKKEVIFGLLSFLFSCSVSAITKTMNSSYTQTTTITPLSGVTQISNLTVSGSIVFNNDSSLVRILLRDASGTEYLVYESYPLCASSKSFSFTNEAEETNVLLNIAPTSIIIVVLNATLNIQKFDYSTLTPTLTSAQVLQSQLQNVHNKNSNKISWITSNKTLYNMKWIAGHTQLSDFMFSVKKRYLGNRVDYNESGYEFYTGGVFRWMSQPYSGLKSGSTSAYVAEFDWRKMHNAHLPSSPYYDGDATGGGWATPVKNQLWSNPLVCGSCWDHAAVALTEMYINLYYNKHIDKDLSEQELISCSGSDCSGGITSFALNYIMRNGIVDENCFPYVGYEQPCSQRCTPQNTVKISNYSGVTWSSSDDIKRMLVTYGPIAGGHSGHAQLLVGWQTDENGSTIWIYKDSHGMNHGVNGFTYENESNGHHFDDYVTGAPIGINETPQCFDKDGDGYYFWGIGSKPSSCPPCTPDDEDWNDNDPTRAILDKNTGEIKLITSPPIGLVTNISVGSQDFTYWTTNQFPCGDVMVKCPYASGNSNIRGLIIQANVNMVANATLTTDNCTTKLIGGTIDNANVVLKNNGKLIIADGGTLKLGPNDKLSVTLGSSLVLLKSKFVVK